MTANLIDLGLTHMVIPVGDTERSIAFYEKSPSRE